MFFFGSIWPFGFTAKPSKGSGVAARVVVEPPDDLEHGRAEGRVTRQVGRERWVRFFRPGSLATSFQYKSESTVSSLPAV